MENELTKLSNLCASLIDQDADIEFLKFKGQLEIVQNLVDEYNGKIIDKTLCSDDLENMKTEMACMMELEQLVTKEKMKSSYVAYKTMALNIIQESYRIWGWFLEEQCRELDNVFQLNTYIDKIIEACNGKEDPLGHLNILFKGVFKNTTKFDLNFYGAIKFDANAEPLVLTQTKKEKKSSKKQELERLIVPVEVENDIGDNELEMTLVRVKKSLKRAVINNNKKPVSFHKFAIDPFSLTYTVENLFNLASLVRDGVVIIERVPDDEHYEFSTLTLASKSNKNKTTNVEDNISSLFKMNHALWKHYLKKYKITERMIEQDEDQ